MRASEYRDKTLAELEISELDLRKELFNLRFQSATGEIQNPARIGQVRRDMSRVLQVMGEKRRTEIANEDGK